VGAKWCRTKHWVCFLAGLCFTVNILQDYQTWLCALCLSLSPAIFPRTWISQYQNISVLDFTGAKVDGSGGDNWSYRRAKASVLPVTKTPASNFLQAGCPSCCVPNQQCQSTEGKAHVCTKSMSDKAFKSLSITRIHLVVEDKLWNSLPDDITSASSLSVFRKKLKTHLFRQSYPDIIF